MEENLTNEVVESVVEEAMTKNNSGKAVGILGVGMILGAGLIVVGKKIATKIREKKMIVVEQTTDEEPEEEDSDEE